LTAARSVKGNIDTDADATSLDLFRTLIAPIMQRQYSQELNLTGKFDALTFVTGAYYFQENVREPLSLALPGFGVSHLQRPRLKAESYAFFAQGEYEFMPGFSAVAGLRYTHEKKDYFLRDFWTASASLDPRVAESAPTVGAPFFADPFTVNTSRKDHAWTPKFGLNYKPNEDVLVYASVTRGFKSGGYDYGATNATDAAAGYSPEYLWAYEVGVKSEWLDKRVRANLSGFYYDYSDLQVTLFTPPANSVTNNAASAKVKGIEAELQARVIGGLDVFANFAYLDAYYSSYPGARVTAFGPFNAAGKRLNSSPEFSMTLGGQYTYELGDTGSVYAGVDYHWQSTIYFTPANAGVGAVTNYAERQTGYGLWNARVGWDSPEKQWGFAVIGRNLADKGYVTGTVNYTPNIAGHVGAPRTVIAQLSFKY
jgi:iron complex outermembrane receptor protein